MRRELGRTVVWLAFCAVLAIADFLRRIGLGWLAYVAVAAGIVLAARMLIDRLAAPFEKRSTPARGPAQ
jgi:hypothetical protein